MALNPTGLKPVFGRREPAGRKHDPVKFTACLLVLAGLLIYPAVSIAYVGPGAGITALGALWALIATVVITLVGLLIWPIRALMKRKKQSGVPDEESESGEIAKPDSE